MTTMTYFEAISAGMREEMRRNPRVFILGEDVGIYGGAFKATKGFSRNLDPTGSMIRY